MRITAQPPGPRPKGRGAHLHIFCLGPFRVYRDGRKIADADWGQGKGPAQKVKALFTYLVAKGGHGATKDEIVELLWRDRPDDHRVNACFHATMYYLRRALEPELPPRGKPQYITYQDGYYKLAPPHGYWVDTLAFEAHYQQALRLEEQGQDEIAARHWKLAEALYQGEYLASIARRYTEGYEDDWCQLPRYRFKDMYLTVLLRLADYHFRSGEGRLSRVYAERALAQDPGCEKAHRLVMRLLHREGRYGDLLRQYSMCQQYLGQAENRSPEPETKRLYERLVRGSPRVSA
jgi:DNA-binding SARP family transcriptional activator